MNFLLHKQRKKQDNVVTVTMETHSRVSRVIYIVKGISKR